jgi:hypothetical protein
MPRKQHDGCAEDPVIVAVGEQFEWITTCDEYCDIHIIDDNPLDSKDYHVVKGTPYPATVIGQPNANGYEFTCKCKGAHLPQTNPKIIIS